MSLTYEPSSEPLHISAKWLFLNSLVEQERVDYALACVGGVMMAVALLELLPEAHRLNRYLFTLVTGPRRSLSFKLSDTTVYELQIRAHLGIAKQ